MKKRRALPKTVSDKDTDRYLSPLWVCDLVREVLVDEIDLDPFHEADSHTRANKTIDARSGGNAYVDHWVGRNALANGPYSARYPAATAHRCAEMHVQHGLEVFNLCPAAPGSDYWRSWVWPNATAIVWLGRLAFEAAVDIVKDGKIVCPKGTAQNGNRTEIAMPYLGDRPDRVRQVFCRRAEVTLL